MLCAARRHLPFIGELLAESQSCKDCAMSFRLLRETRVGAQSVVLLRASLANFQINIGDHARDR